MERPRGVPRPPGIGPVRVALREATGPAHQALHHAAQFVRLGCGVTAAMVVGDSDVLWFRPEAIRTISWGGDPRKRAALDATGLRPHPRKSFKAWEETVRLRALPCHSAEIEAAGDLRTAIIDIVLRNAEETAEPSERLILVVDDEALVRSATAAMLSGLGHRVIESGSAAQALSLLDSGVAPDLVITDYLMPGMNGADLAREIRSRQPCLPVLLATG